jgi:hypothetical protein
MLTLSMSCDEVLKNKSYFVVQDAESNEKLVDNLLNGNIDRVNPDLPLTHQTRSGCSPNRPRAAMAATIRGWARVGIFRI